MTCSMMCRLHGALSRVKAGLALGQYLNGTQQTILAREYLNLMTSSKKSQKETCWSDAYERLESEARYKQH